MIGQKLGIDALEETDGGVYLLGDVDAIGVIVYHFLDLFDHAGGFFDGGFETIGMLYFHFRLKIKDKR